MNTRLRSIEKRLLSKVRDDSEAAIASRLAAFAGRPVDYARDVLRSGLTPKQQEILEKLTKPPYRVLARSANTQGKTFVAAVKCSHFFDTVRPSITLATAPVYKQVRDLLFKEMRTLRPSQAGFAPKDTRLQGSRPDHFVHGFTANSADAFQGHHGCDLGLVFDEATGIDPDFWRRGETMFESTGRHWWLCCYNPNDSASPAYVAEESGTWATVCLSALEHPNVLAELQGDPAPIPSAVQLATVLRRMAAECVEVTIPDPATDFEFPAGSGIWWHPNTPDFEAQILGRWPSLAAAALFSPYLAERCFATVYPIDPAAMITAGCDVARFGDDKTTICVRVGPSVVKLETHSGVTTTWIAERLRGTLRQLFGELGLDKDASTTVPVFIDDTGGYGAGVIDQSEGYNFIGINNSAECPAPDRYPNNRSYLWCELAALASANALDLSRLSLNDRLSVKQELTAARYELDARNRRRLWPKVKIKELIGRSPDRADAICLAFYGATVEM